MSYHFGRGVTIDSIGSTPGRPSLAAMTFSVENGVSIDGEELQGVHTLELKDGVLYLNGKPHAPGKKQPYDSLVLTITGSVTGDVNTTSGNVTVLGNAQQVGTMSGSVRVEGSVGHGVHTMSGSVHVEGSVVPPARVASMSGHVQVVAPTHGPKEEEEEEKPAKRKRAAGKDTPKAKRQRLLEREDSSAEGKE